VHIDKRNCEFPCALANMFVDNGRNATTHIEPRHTSTNGRESMHILYLANTFEGFGCRIGECEMCNEYKNTTMRVHFRTLLRG